MVANTHLGDSSGVQGAAVVVEVYRGRALGALEEVRLRTNDFTNRRYRPRSAYGSTNFVDFCFYWCVYLSVVLIVCVQRQSTANLVRMYALTSSRYVSNLEEAIITCNMSLGRAGTAYYICGEKHRHGF